MPRMTVDLSDDASAQLDRIATKNGITKVEAIRRALNLLNVAAEEKEKGNELAVVDKSVKPVARLVGIL
jgi:predicted transcriptional regulator